LFLIREADGAVTRHETNPLIDANPEPAAVQDAPDEAATKSLDALRALDIEKATGQELRKALKAAGVEVPKGATKAQLEQWAADVLANPETEEADDQEDGDGEEEAADQEDGA